MLQLLRVFLLIRNCLEGLSLSKLIGLEGPACLEGLISIIYEVHLESLDQ